MQSDDFAENKKLFLSPLQKLLLGIPVKKAIMAWGTMGSGKAGKRVLFSTEASAEERRIVQKSPNFRL